MSNNNKFFDDCYKLAGSAMNTAFGTAADLKKQFEDMVHSKIDEILKNRGYVTAEEFNVVKKMVQKSRAEQEELAAKIAKLEKKIGKK